jgi:hypothetical protein
MQPAATTPSRAFSMPKPFSVGRLEVGRQLLVAKRVAEHPVVEVVGVVFVAEQAGKVFFLLLAHQHLRRAEALQQLVDVGRVALGGEKTRPWTRRGRRCPSRHPEVEGAQVVVALAVEHVVVERHAGGHQFGHAALDDALGHLGVFELVADGDAFAGPHQLGQVSVEGVVRKARQRHVAGRPVGTLGENNVEDFAGLDGILPEGFVKIAYPEQQQRPRVPGLDEVVLLHQGRLFGRGRFSGFGLGGIGQDIYLN